MPSTPRCQPMSSLRAEMLTHACFSTNLKPFSTGAALYLANSASASSIEANVAPRATSRMTNL